MSTTTFETVIKDYLDNRAREDSLFAETYKKANKSIKECCRYIISRAPARRKPLPRPDNQLSKPKHEPDKRKSKMEGTTKLNTLTNIVYILTDVLETNLMDMEAAYRREGYGLRHDVKRQYNAAIHAIRRLKADIDKCSDSEQESFGNDADIVNALLLTLLDRVGDDDMLAFKFFNYIKSFPSKLGLDLQVDGAFAHLFGEKP